MYFLSELYHVGFFYIYFIKLYGFVYIVSITGHGLKQGIVADQLDNLWGHRVTRPILSGRFIIHVALTGWHH